jgi:hypothetical protein
LDAKYFTLWTRFKELHRLSSALSKLHQQLYLSGEFPQFSKPKLFGKNDSQTIAERCTTAEAFLNFSVSHEVLRRSKVLLDFFEVSTWIVS